MSCVAWQLNGVGKKMIICFDISFPNPSGFVCVVASILIPHWRVTSGKIWSLWMNFQSSCLLLKLGSIWALYRLDISLCKARHQVTIYHTLLGRNNLKILTMPKFYTDSLLACEFLLLDKIFTAKRILTDKLPTEYGIQLLIIACSQPIRGGIRAY